MAQHGYPDWQPPGIIIPSSGESPVLETVAAVERVGKYVGAVLEVVQYSKIRLRATAVKGGFLILTLEWFTDPELTRPAGKRLITIGDGTQGSPAGDLQASVDNLGPFLRCTLAASAGEAAHWEGGLEVVAHNRPLVLQCAVEQPVLLRAEGIAVKENEAYAVQPNYYYAGPVQIQAYASKTSTVHQIHVFDPVLKVWVSLVNYTVKKALEWESFAFQVPLGAWRGILYADAGSGGASMYIVGPADVTGSS